MEEKLEERYLQDPKLGGLMAIRNQSFEERNDNEQMDKSKLKEMVTYLLTKHDVTKGSLLQRYNVQVMSGKRRGALQSEQDGKPLARRMQDAEVNAKSCAVEIRDKQKFYEKCKNAQRLATPEDDEEPNCQLKYFQEAQKHGVLSLPILSKVHRGRLDLRGYGLNDGVCKSFAEAIQGMPELLNFVILASNGLKDGQLAVLLEALQEQTDLRQLIIKLNDFGEESLETLCNLLARPMPHQL